MLLLRFKACFQGIEGLSLLTFAFLDKLIIIGVDTLTVSLVTSYRCSKIGRGLHLTYLAEGSFLLFQIYEESFSFLIEFFLEFRQRIELKFTATYKVDN